MTVAVFGIINNRTESANDTFRKYTNQPEDYGFSKTTIPVELLTYGENDKLFMARSQARRLMVRLDKFKNILLDFSGIDEIGQGFADEIFRVFVNEHPDIRIITSNCSPAVAGMIKHVQAVD